MSAILRWMAMGMQDQYEREINYLRLSVIGSCDCRCPYCVPHGEKMHCQPLLSADELTELAHAAVSCGVHKIRLTGGEPLLRKDIVELCRRMALIPGVEELCLTTNGIHLTRLAPELKRAGVSRLNISLDTLLPERFHSLTGHDCLGKVLQGIEAAQREGFDRIKLNVVLMAGINEDEIPNFITFGRETALNVRFIELMPIGPCAAFARAHYLPAEAVLKAYPELRFLQQDGVAQLYTLPGTVGRVGLIRPISHKFCAQCQRIRIDSSGMLRPCLHSTEGIVLRGLHGKELENAVRAGILHKPHEHTILAGKPVQTQMMYQIGG